MLVQPKTTIIINQSTPLIQVSTYPSTKTPALFYNELTLLRLPDVFAEHIQVDGQLIIEVVNAHVLLQHVPDINWEKSIISRQNSWEQFNISLDVF